MTKQSEIKALQKENDKIRLKIDNILKEYMATIDDNYSDVWELMNALIENEIEQESLCGV